MDFIYVIYLTEDLFKNILEVWHNFHYFFTPVTGIGNKTQYFTTVFLTPQSFETHLHFTHGKYVQNEIKRFYARAWNK